MTAYHEPGPGNIALTKTGISCLHGEGEKKKKTTVISEKDTYSAGNKMRYGDGECPEGASLVEVV